MLMVSVGVFAPMVYAGAAEHRALVIGVGAYQDPALRPGSESAPADADAIAEVLRQSRSTIDVTELSGFVTEGELRSALRSATDGRGLDDSLIVFYAGHAIAVANSRAPGGWDLYFQSSESSATDPESKAVPLSILLQGLSEFPPRNVLILIDACRTPTSGRPYTPPPSAFETWGHPGVWALVYATAPLDCAAADAEHGFFTEALLAGAELSGGSYRADADRNGAVTSVEWALFALSATAARTSNRQRPQALFDVRGRERFVLLGEERSADRALVYGASHQVDVRGYRGQAADVAPGLVRVAVLEEDHAPLTALVRVRAGEEFRSDALTEDPPGKLYLGSSIAASGTDLSSPFAASVELGWVPRDLGLYRLELGARLGWGIGSVDGVRFPNASLLSTVGLGIGAVSAGPSGLDRFELGPLIGVGVLGRWPEAVPGGDVLWRDSASQYGLLGLAGLGGHVEVSRWLIGVELAARLPLVDEAWEVEPSLSVSIRRRVAAWGVR